MNTLQSGDFVLHYRIERWLGAGGMGVVYQALDTRLERRVALKFLPDAGNGARMHARLLHEARAAAALDHPNVGIVHALEAADDGTPFIVMAHYDGKTLDRALVPRPWPEARRIAVQVANALEHAHRASVIHCDVKPGNVLVTPEGVVKLLDFGLASLKRPGALANGSLGTMEYMAPEQVRGGEPAAPSDVWSLGVVLYEILTGVSPFRAGGGTADTIRAILYRDPVPPTERDRSLPVGVDAVVGRALRVRLDERYPTAAALRADLERIGTDRARGRPAGRFASGRSGGDERRGPLDAHTSSPLDPPVMTTPCIGRDVERTLIEAYLADPACRAVSLVGLGGVGKTLLATHAARDAIERGTFDDGVHVVPLTSCTNGAVAASVTAAALGVPTVGPSGAVDAIVDHVGASSTLLVLDEVEHLVDEVDWVEDVLLRCPGVKVVTTSRVRPTFADGWVVPVDPLTLPERDEVSPAQAARYPAIALFAQRARRSLPDFTVTASNVTAVVRLCRALGGLPLAIELAAPWLRILGVDDIVGAVDDAPDLLDEHGSRSEVRTRRLGATFDRSWGLLTPTQRAVAMRLAVFEGGFDAEAADTVAGASAAILAALVDASLVTRTPAGRFEQHRLVVRYARRRLAADPDAADLAGRRHADHYMQWLVRNARALRGSEQASALAAIRAELPNVRRAWEATVRRVRVERAADTSTRDARAADTSPFATAADALRLFHDRHGDVGSGIALLRAALDVAPDDGHVQVHLAWLTMLAGEPVDADAFARAGIDRLDPERDTHAVVTGWTTRGAVASDRGDHADAATSFRRALELAEQRGDDATVARCLDNLATALQALERSEEAIDLYLRSLAIARRNGDAAQVVVNLNNLGTLYLHGGRLDDASHVLDEGVAAATGAGLDRFVPYLLANRAECAFGRGAFAEARSTLERAIPLATERGDDRLALALHAELGRCEIAAGAVDGGVVTLLESVREAHAAALATIVLRALVYLAEHILEADAPNHELAARIASFVADDRATAARDKALARRLLDRCGSTADAGASLDRLVHDVLSARLATLVRRGSAAVSGRPVPGPAEP